MLIVLVGLVLFLYGVNYYDATVGWTGFGLFIGGIVFYVFLKLRTILGESKQKKQAVG